MTGDSKSPFELRLQVDFPQDVIFIEPPVPVSPLDTVRPQIQTELGKIYIYFSNFDAPVGNAPGDPSTSASTFYVHFIPGDVPPAVEQLLAAPSSELARGLIDDPFDPRIVELEKEHGFGIRVPEPPEEYKRRKHIESLLNELYGELERQSKAQCARIFSDPELSSYFTGMGKVIGTTTQSFLEILRLKYRQYLIPDRAEIHWTFGYWVLPESILSPDWIRRRKEGTTGVMDGNLINFDSGVSDANVDERVMPATKAFLDRILPSGESGDSPAVKPGDWPEIADQITKGGMPKPDLSEVLIATALGECDPRMGNPRLGLIEAVVALEVEVKSLMKDALKQYGIGDKAIERLVKETPLADLTSVWIRREIPEGVESAFDNTLLEKCAKAIIERNLLIHRRQRSISRDKALEYILAIAELLENVTRWREARGLE
jgi:hypothetical protein